MVRKLSDKKNTFCVNGGCSAEKLLTCGVSQGSILGPLLFLIYINDLPLATRVFAHLFSDDTSFLMSLPDIEFLILSENVELKKASQWLKANRLKLNVSKTKYMVFRKKSMPLNTDKCRILIENEELEKIGQDCNITLTFNLWFINSMFNQVTFSIRSQAVLYLT